MTVKTTIMVMITIMTIITIHPTPLLPIRTVPKASASIWINIVTYISDPREIYRQSFAHIRNSLDLDSLGAGPGRVVERVIHSCGMLDLIDDIRYSPGFVRAGIEAIRDGKPIICDSRMVTTGIIRNNLTHCNRVYAAIDANDRAPGPGVTRSASAIERCAADLIGAVAVIGNAPTALFRLLEMVAEGTTAPALIIGIPVGFIGASESKEELHSCGHTMEYFTVLGTRGGSAMAAATVNALALMATSGDD